MRHQMYAPSYGMVESVCISRIAVAVAGYGGTLNLVLYGQAVLSIENQIKPFHRTFIYAITG